MRLSLPSIKYSAAPSSFWLLSSARWSNRIVEHSSDNIVWSWEEPPNIWLTVVKNTFVGWALNFRVHMLLKSTVIRLTVQLAQPFKFQARNVKILLTILHESIFVFYSRSCTAKNLSRWQGLTLWNLHLVVFTQIFIHGLHDQHKKNDYT